MLKRTHRIGAVALSAAMMFMAACSESVDDTASSNTTAKNDSTESTAPQTRTTRGITDTSIKVGGVQYGVYFGDASVGVEARIKEANDAGGVHGRTLEFIGAQENNNDATKDLDLVRALVEQDEVFALLPVMAGTFGATDYIVDNNIPTFGYGITPAFCNNEIAFGVTGCVTNPDLTVGSNALGTVLADYFDGDTNKTIAFIGEDNDAGRGGLALLGASVEDKGFEIVYSEPAMPAPPEQVGDVSPFVSALLAEDPDVIYLQATLSGTKIADALQQADYDGVIISPSFSPLLLGQPGYEGILINTQVGVDPEIEGLAHLLESVHAIKPDQQLSLALITGYLAADMFIKGLEETGEDLTVENFLATMNGGFTYSVDGVVGESTWPDNHSKPVPCSVLTKTENAQFVPFQALQCGTNIDVK
ncbi:MAG TPA: ABC transporter substrate-binding protein [Microthrixaceae bacterium]|nr:ABC transporter substrate-binding protein [Microthrixaceae bacterium]